MSYAPSGYLNDGLQFFPLVSWTEGNGVSGPHLGHLVDANIRDHRTVTTWGIPVVQSLLILLTTKGLERAP